MAKVDSGSTIKNKAYLFYDDGTYFLNVVPRMLGLQNGGTNADLSTVLPNSVYIQGTEGFTAVEATGGAFYSPVVNGVSQTPTFGTLPVGYGGTGATTFASNALLLGNGTGAIKTLGVGSNTQLLGSNGTIPKWYTPKLSITTTATTSTLKLKLVSELTANLPIANTSSAGLITAGTTLQTFGGPKAFNGTVDFNQKVKTNLSSDAYYNSADDYSDGDIMTSGGITVGSNLRVDGNQIEVATAAILRYDNTKSCLNFVFL